MLLYLLTITCGRLIMMFQALALLPSSLAPIGCQFESSGSIQLLYCQSEQTLVVFIVDN